MEQDTLVPVYGNGNLNVTMDQKYKLYTRLSRDDNIYYDPWGTTATVKVITHCQTTVFQWLAVFILPTPQSPSPICRDANFYITPLIASHRILQKQKNIKLKPWSFKPDKLLYDMG